MNDNTVCIYELIDPLSKMVYYIGQTKDPDKRLWQHDNTLNHSNLMLSRWAEGLHSVGLHPILHIVERVPGEDADAAEQRHIADGVTCQWPLFNKALMPRADARARNEIYKLKNKILHLECHIETLEWQVKDLKHYRCKLCKVAL